MEKAAAYLFLLLILTGLASSQENNEWDVFANTSSSSEDENESQAFLFEGDDLGPETSEDVSDLEEPIREEREAEKTYTPNFYIAIGVGLIGLLIILFFVYLFVKKRPNQWEN